MKIKLAVVIVAVNVVNDDSFLLALCRWWSSKPGMPAMFSTRKLVIWIQTAVWKFRCNITAIPEISYSGNYSRTQVFASIKLWLYG